ncbi:MAG: TetR/AcrR family transcriptional regulator [Ktedonobacteraceae bacterium]|nr:TetR/AcrR family transcriptional regulator [Chloroflexota bacterium]
MKRKRGEAGQSLVDEGETREQILDAARQLFLARGYKGVSMKDIAEAVQVTSAALYYHFPEGKQELFFSVIQALLAAWVQGALLATASVQGLAERLKWLTEYMFTLPIDRFEMLMRDAHENVFDHGAKREDMEQIQKVFVQHVIIIFQEAIDIGEIPGDVPAAVLAAMYMGMSISLLSSKHQVMGGIENREIIDADARQLAAFIVSVLLKGVADTTPGASIV